MRGALVSCLWIAIASVAELFEPLSHALDLRPADSLRLLGVKTSVSSGKACVVLKEGVHAV